MSMAVNLTKLRTISAAPISSTTARAISATTSVPRRRRWSGVAVDAFVRPERAWLPCWPDRNAGGRLQSTPVRTARDSPKRMTRRSMPIVVVVAYIRLGGARFTSVSTAHVAATRPATPASRPRSSPSTSSSRARRPRLAPSTRRIANSRCLSTALDSSRLATFAQAVNSTRPTAPNRISTVRCVAGSGPARRPWYKRILQPVGIGCSTSRRAAAAAMRCPAVSFVRPALRRTTTLAAPSPGPGLASGSSGSHICSRMVGK